MLVFHNVAFFPHLLCPIPREVWTAIPQVSPVNNSVLQHQQLHVCHQDSGVAQTHSELATLLIIAYVGDMLEAYRGRNVDSSLCWRSFAS